MTDEEDNNGKQLCVYERGRRRRMRLAGFRCDLALRCGDGIQCPGLYVNHVVLDGCYPQNAQFKAAWM